MIFLFVCLVTGYLGLNYYLKVISENFIRLKMEASSSSGSATANPVQSCSMCPDKFLSNDKLVLHYVINHKYHICEVCTTDDLKNHESETHLPLKCEICCYQITELSELTTHRATSHQLLTCHFCPLTLNTMFELNFHLKRKHFVLVEPLNLDQGLFKDFSMGKWGYLCLLCGKNRETSGFIGHYRGFHRIRVPTLAKILLKQNITPLSIMGTLGPEEEADHTKDLPDIDHTTHQPYANVSNTCNDSGQRQYQADVDLANIDGNITSGSSQQTCIGVPKVEYPCHQTLIVPKVPETYLQTVYQMNAHMNQTLPVPSAICHQTRAIPNVSAPNAHELHTPNLSGNDMGGPHETHVADNAMSSNICQQYTGVPAKHDFHSTLQPGVGVPNPSSHTYQIQSATNELPADPLKPEPIENKHSVASEGTRACGNIANQLTNEERLNYMPQYNRVPCDNPVNIRQGGNMGERLDMSGYPHQSVITNARGSAVHQPSEVVPSHLTHQLDSSHLVDNIQTSQLPNQISGTPYSSQSGDPNHSDTPYACQLSSNANQISRPPYGTDSSDNTGAMLPSQSYPGVVVGAYSEGLDGSGSQNIGHDVKYRLELSGGSGSQNTGSIPQYSSDLGADSGSQNIDSKMAYSAGLDGSQDTAGGNASGGDSLLYSMLLQGNRNPEESLEPPVIRQPTQDNSAAISPTSPTLPPDLSVSREDKFSSEPEDTSDEESTSSRRDGGMSSGYYVAGTSKPLATTDPSDEESTSSRRDGGMTSGYYVAGTSKPLATTDPSDEESTSSRRDGGMSSGYYVAGTSKPLATTDPSDEESTSSRRDGGMTSGYYVAGTSKPLATTDPSDEESTSSRRDGGMSSGYYVAGTSKPLATTDPSDEESTSSRRDGGMSSGYYVAGTSKPLATTDPSDEESTSSRRDGGMTSGYYVAGTSKPLATTDPSDEESTSSRRDGGMSSGYYVAGTSKPLATTDPSDEESTSSRRDGGMSSGYYVAGTSKPLATTDPRLYEDFDDVEPEVDPNDVECVLTETSDVESVTQEEEEEEGEGGEGEGSGSEKLMTRLYNMAMQGGTVSQVNTSDDSDVKQDCPDNIPKKLGKYLVLNNLVICSKIGLNQMEHAPNGFRCEVCHGYFDSREGLKELLRHMRTLHGIKCNKDTRHLSSVFDNFGRIKMTSYPEYCGPIHVCPFCSLRASSKRFLRRHVFTFHGDTWLLDAPAGPLSYACGQCKRSFWHMRERDVHEMSEHEDVSPLRCHICVRPFLRKVLVNEHIRLSHPEENGMHGCVSYKCRSCDILLADYTSLESHVKTEHNHNTVYRCSHCDLGLKNMKSLRYHIKMQHGKASQTFECELCGRVTYSLRSLNSHRRLKHDSAHRALFKCRLCSDTFETKDERQLHYAKQHVNQNPFICPDCGKGFASKSGLYGHRQVHKVQENFFKCQFCGKEFTRRDSYNEHLLIHMGPRHKCPHCNKDFVQRSNLVRHIRIHTGEKPYKCTHCDKTFSDKGACNSHIRVHTGEETCACPFCGQTFSKKQKLKYHVRKHTGEGLLECDICNKTFTNSYALKDHKATHARSAQNFNCIQCGSAFTENRFLNRHLSVVHSDIPCFACPFCEKIFSHQKALRTHILIHAGVAYLECASCSIKFVSRTSLHDHLAAEHAISVNHEFYHASFISLEPEQVGLVMPKFTDEEVLNMSNQERDEVMRDYFNQVIEGKIELETQFEFKLIQRNRAPVDPDKKGLIAKLKQEQRKSRPPPKKRGGKAGGVGDWGPGRRKGRGGKRGRREEGGGGGHDYNFRANYPRTIMSEDYDYENEQEDYSEDHDNYDAPSVHETSVINLSLRNPSNPTRRRQNSGHESGGEEMEEEEGQMPVEAFLAVRMFLIRMLIQTSIFVREISDEVRGTK
ncbi:hypothetical protein M8J76_003693 [Diaphorina citri]|nr:hypothetical protein M8J76_003693 [Diaphorina citri]